MTYEEYLILKGMVDTFDEMGFPDDCGEYDINGWPLPVLYCEE